MIRIIAINRGTELAPVTAHMSMTQTPVKRINEFVSKIIISTSYIHKQVALGLPSFNDKCKPSFGLDISTD